MKRERATLGELCDVVKGTSPIMKTLPGKFPLVTTAEDFKTAADYQLEGSAVCIPLVSGTGHGHASMKRVHHVEGRFALANIMSAALIKDQRKLSPRYLAQYLTYHKDRLLVPLMTGAANMSLSIDRIKTVPISFPPLAEQDRLVGLLDDADALRKLRAHAQARTAQLIPTIFQEMFGESEGLEQVPLGDLCERITKGESPGWQGFEYTEHGAMFVTSENVLWGELDVRAPKHIPVPFHEKLGRSQLRARDVLINLVGASIGRCAIVPDALGEANINQAVATLSPKTELSEVYLMWHLLSTKAQDYFHGGKVEAARANISLGDIRAYQLPVPSSKQQDEFAARVAEVRALQGVQSAARGKVEALWKSLLGEVFG